MSLTARAKSELHAIARAYLRQASAIDLRALAANQDGPWTNIAFGAAGIAYALWRAGGAGRSARLEQADRLLREAAAAAPKDYWPAIGSTPRSALGPGLFYGPAGIGYVRVLVAHARDDRPTYERELSAFLKTCRAADAEKHELLVGTAGLLDGARILHELTKDARVAKVAETLAKTLEQRAHADAGGWARWTGTSAQGFAHGAPGILHASLAWSEHARREPGPATMRALEGFAKRPKGAPSKLGDADALPRVMERSWCNGSAGRLLLWAKAYEHTGEKAYLELARASAGTTLTALRGSRADLCCGFGGRAYALLAMDRIDARGGWHRRATEMAVRAFRAAEAAIGAWPNGLLKGYPGLVCLVGDLEAPRRKRRGFPLVEG